MQLKVRHEQHTKWCGPLSHLAAVDQGHVLVDVHALFLKQSRDLKGGLGQHAWAVYTRDSSVLGTPFNLITDPV